MYPVGGVSFLNTSGFTVVTTQLFKTGSHDWCNQECNDPQCFTGIGLESVVPWFSQLYQDLLRNGVKEDGVHHFH